MEVNGSGKTLTYKTFYGRNCCRIVTYYIATTITAVKSFIVQAPGVNYICIYVIKGTRTK